MRRLRILSLVAFGHIGFALAPSAAVAQLAQDTTTFTGTVPGACTITGLNAPVSLTYSNANNGTLSATSGNIVINANVAAKVSLSSLTNTAKPNNTTPVATATLNDATGSRNGIATATVGNNSSNVALSNTVGQNHNVTIGLTATAASLPGDYTWTVVLSCLQ